MSKRPDPKTRPAQINVLIPERIRHKAKVNLAKKKKTISEAVRECLEEIAK